MKKTLTFILLLCHMNFSMFLPQMAEQDIFDASGQQEDDINSAIEFIDQVVLGHKDDTPEDEDDDDGQNFITIKTVDLFCQQIIIAVQPTYNKKTLLQYPESDYQALPSAILDILSPPPKA